MNFLDEFLDRHIQRSVRIYSIGTTWFKGYEDLLTYNGINYGTAFFVPLMVQLVVGEANEENNNLLRK